jgi:hypothetical protein
VSDHPFDFVDDILPDEPNGELVHWMQAKPMSMGLPQISAAAAGAFALGAVTAITVLAVMHWIGPERTAQMPNRLRRLRAKVR